MGGAPGLQTNSTQFIVRMIHLPFCGMGGDALRATSHMRLRARDQVTSSTLIGGKGGAHPSSLRTTLEGPTEYVNARWM